MTRPLVTFTFICLECNDPFTHHTPVPICGRCAYLLRINPQDYRIGGEG